MASLNIQQALEAAFARHQAGKLSEAEAIYRQILSVAPNNPDALHLLGVLAGQAEKPEIAVDLISRAIAVQPGIADFHNNLAKFLKDGERFEESVAACRRALALNPKHVEAYNNLGLALKALDQWDQAIAAYAEVFKLKPDHAEAHKNLGEALKAKGQIDRAIAEYREAIRLRPNYAQAYNSLSVALRENWELDGAIDTASRAISYKSEYADACNNLGNALRLKGRIDEAAAAYRRAIEFAPDSAFVHGNLALALLEQWKLEEAIAESTEALRLKSDYPEAYNNLGNIYKEQARFDEAIESYRKAIALAPKNADYHDNLVYFLNFHPDYDAARVLAEHQAWDRQHARALRGEIPHKNDRSPNRRLRIGYVSPDFRNHVVGRNMLPLLREQDHQAFEIFCYSNGRNADAVTAQFHGYADYWRDVWRDSDEQLATRIREDRIDILVDLALHMAGNRLLAFARKPAPIQATFAGYPGTTGMTAMDYRLTDPYLDPPGESDSNYAERSIRLASTFWCYDHRQEMPDVQALPALSAEHITFGCLNNFCKINNRVLELWARTMQSVAGSRLLVLCWPGRHRDWFLRTMARQEIAEDRIEFADPRPLGDYLRLYHRIDIGLDTFPYNGHTTSLDSYWMGVPVVTLAGKTAVGRAGLSQLTNLGMTELAAGGEDEFVSIAKELAGDLDRLKSMRASLRERMRSSPIMDARACARSIESGYQEMWRQWTV
jgi:predicted O-linked N-acetylglucosamine transferase (SPINDLY family)